MNPYYAPQYPCSTPLASMYQQQQHVRWLTGYPTPYGYPTIMPNQQIAYCYTPMSIMHHWTNPVPNVPATQPQRQNQYQIQTPCHQPLASIPSAPNNHRNKAAIEFLLNPPDEAKAIQTPLPSPSAVCSPPMPCDRERNFLQQVHTAKNQDAVFGSAMRSSTLDTCLSIKTALTSPILGVQASTVTKEQPQRRSRQSNPNGKPKKRQVWTPEQDAMLIHAVAKCGAKNWPRIASFIPGRSADNARLRYMYSLQYSGKNSSVSAERPFTEDEDAVILKEAEGNRQWKKVGQDMGRSCGAVRNRFDVLRRMAMRKERKMARVNECQERMKSTLKQFEEPDQLLET